MSKVLGQSLLEAGREAIDRLSWHEAYDLLNEASAQESLGPEDLERLADSAWWTGQLEANIAARQEAYAGYINRGDRRSAARCAVGLSHDYLGKLAHSLGTGWLSRAERLLEDEPDSPEHGHLLFLKAFLAYNDGRYDETEELAGKILEIGTRFGDRDLQAFGLLFQGRVRMVRGEVEPGLRLLDESTVAAVSGELGPFATGVVYCMAITATSTLRDYRRAGEWTEAAKRWCDRQSISGFPGACRIHRGHIMQLRGAWKEAEKDVRLALNELKDFNLELAAEAFYELGEIRLRVGDLKAAEEAFRQAEELGLEPQPGRALLQMAEGKVEAAAGGLKRALEEDIPDPLFRFPLLHAQVEIALAAGDFASAEGATEQLDEIAKTYGTAALHASAEHARSALQIARDDPEGAIRSLRKALRLWKEADVPYEAARSRLALADAYRRAGEPESAQSELKAAASAFNRLGAALDLRRAYELMGKEGESELTAAPRTVKTFMFTDIVKSTNLVEAMGDEAWGHLLQWHDRNLRSLFLASRGEEVKQAGDGFFVAFDHPRDAIDCAVAIQRTLAEHRRAHGFAPKVRIGLHSGDAARKGSDYEGRQVHQAARIGALAGGDEILLSKTTYADSNSGCPVAEMRTATLKGFSEPVDLVVLDWH